MDRTEIDVYATPTALMRSAAETITTRAARAVAERGRFSVALSGGSTPRALYALLAADEFAARIPWPQVDVFWGDERCVPPDHADSNYRMARETLLDRVPIPASNIHRMRGEISPAEAALEYEGVLRAYFAPKSGQGQAQARFDVLLLGLGDDGHTASLFPHTPALREHARWVVENWVAKLDAWRITLTPPAINAATLILFLVAGEGKAQVLRDVLYGPPQTDRYPAQRVQPDGGRLVWMLDAAAAARLPAAPRRS